MPQPLAACHLPSHQARLPLTLPFHPACHPLSQIVFSEGWWVGTAADNPQEARLPEPDWLAAGGTRHQKFDFSTRSRRLEAF